ncbi:hypothetical protein EI427_11995 [Flammeovirga pectinis]|uniref:Uncharacterized protein n=1 Tax=Flammeovirga pectinis TaxID=2494373 RepID=A0A3S9P412_9BACT|nr:hypothetical protein [Flammeovirga pectinis]AZQ62933.1 hypothetical protein EI427_11995 [Flammeovirga pectinis]
MKSILLIATTLFCLGCSSSDEVNTDVRYEAVKGFHKVETSDTLDHEKLIVFTEISDIGKGTITRPEGHIWPEEITLRMPFDRLEGFKAYSNTDKDHLFEQFYSSNPRQPQYVSTFKGSELKTSIKDLPYIDIQLPKEMFQDNPKLIYVEWVNVYRN